MLGSIQANQVRLLYQMQRYDEAIEKAGDSTSVHGTHFWSGCALFARASAEDRAQSRLEWFERAETEFRTALAARPDDWDTKFNFELTRTLLNRLREEPETPRRLLFELIRPQVAPFRGHGAAAAYRLDVLKALNFMHLSQVHSRYSRRLAPPVTGSPARVVQRAGVGRRGKATLS